MPRIIKAEVDTRRAPGRFLLTGSANVLLLPKLSESLAGRMEILTLWPLSQAEVEGSSFVDGLFSPELSLSSMADGAGRMNGADANRVGINRVGADQVVAILSVASCAARRRREPTKSGAALAAARRARHLQHRRSAGLAATAEYWRRGPAGAQPGRHIARSRPALRDSFTASCWKPDVPGATAAGVVSQHRTAAG